MAIHMRGAVAELVCIYQRAALLRAWTLHSVGDSLTLEGEIESLDAHRVRQRPLTFVVQRPAGRKPWRWPVLTLDLIGDKKMRATLGAQE